MSDDECETDEDDGWSNLGDASADDLRTIATIAAAGGVGPYGGFWRAIYAGMIAERRQASDVARGTRFRVEVACDGYENLMEDDVPEGVLDIDAYVLGAEAAARGIRSALHGGPELAAGGAEEPSDPATEPPPAAGD